MIYLFKEKFNFSNQTIQEALFLIFKKQELV